MALPVPAPRDAAAPAVQPSGVPARTSHVRTTLTSRLAAAAAAALVTLAGCAGPDLGATGPGPGDGPATAPAPLPTASPPTQIRDTPPAPAGPQAPATGFPAPTSPPAPQPAVLRLGDRGDEVRDLQQRLSALGYWLGEPDGVFGDATLHAVLAFQTVEGLARDGVVGPRTRRALASASRPQPRSDTGHVVEVDLARQVLIVAVDGRVRYVLDASTGAVPGTTPTGHFEVFRDVDGYDPGPLGTLYRPKYFHGGVAVRGYPDVPPYPASHGCVRVTNAAMDLLWSEDHLPVGQAVWVY
ncbi:MAG: L,D-transpeptidase family protein [Micromonosporaceae bacterium]